MVEKQKSHWSKKSFRDVSRTQSKIYDGAFLHQQLMACKPPFDVRRAYKSFLSRFSLLINYTMWSSNLFPTSSCFPRPGSGSRLFRVRVWGLGPGFRSSPRKTRPKLATTAGDQCKKFEVNKKNTRVTSMTWICCF